MLRIAGLILVVFILVLAAAPAADASVLAGRPFYVWQNLATGAGNIYIFTAAGDFCGQATIAGVGPAGAATVAFQAALDDIINSAAVVPGAVPPPPGPAHFGTWFTSAAPIAGLCGATIGPLTTYYITIF
ncbi:MAG TPA: hypothetical protein VFB49_02800 [Patescibacteria group bacterium]|nr:hypothetical protein [Patescibacteria group bacterium]